MEVLLRRFALLGVWLTIAAIAAGGATAPTSQRQLRTGQPPVAADEHNGGSAWSICQNESARGDAGKGEGIATRGETRTLLAVASAERLLNGVRPKATGSHVGEKPQADRRVLLALERSAAASSTACLPLLRSTHLRI